MASAQVSGTAVMGMADTMPVMSVAPEMHPHDWHYDDRAMRSIEGFTMVAGVAVYAVGNQVRHWRARHLPRPG